jgi:hypothetical protein
MPQGPNQWHRRRVRCTLSCVVERPLNFTGRVRVLMFHVTSQLSVFLSTALLVGCAGAHVRIDGSSPEAFARTHSIMVKSLSSPDRIKLEAAELILLAAASPKGAEVLYSPNVPPSTLRTELNGKSFEEIWKLAGTKDIKVKVGFTTQP